MAIRSCRAASRLWPGLSVNRTIGTSTPSSPPLKPSTWFARCVQAIEGDRKVLIAFKLNDMKIDPYIRTKGERAGEPGASLESTLIHIGLIKIDGTQVYPTSQAQAEAPQAEDAPAPEAEDAADTAADQPIESAEREPAGEVEEQEPALAASF